MIQKWAFSGFLVALFAWSTTNAGHASAAKPGLGDGFILSYEALRIPLAATLDLVGSASRIGARHFNIPILLCQDGPHAVDVQWCESQDAQRLEELTAQILLRGWSVGYLPFLISREGTWRGQFEPSNFLAWGASYRARLVEIAEIGAKFEISDFAVGTELSRLYVAPHSSQQDERNRYWTSVLNEFRARFKKSGRFVSVFAVANWDQAEQIPFWSASDFVGLSSYFPLTSSIDADNSVAALVKGWKPWKKKLIELSKKVDRPLYFNEVGYSSMKSAASEPWRYWPLEALDLELQARLFDAFRRVWAEESSEKVLKRILLWDLVRASHPEKDLGFGVLGKPAEIAVAQLFRDRVEKAGIPEYPVVFTLDDIPAWYVADSQERIHIYQGMLEAFERHGVQPVVFTNPGFVTSVEEWRALHLWEARIGAQFANHTSRHQSVREVGFDAFMRDFDLGQAQLREQGFAHSRFFRLPNADFGPEPEKLCQSLRSKGVTVLPMSFDSRDWAWAEKYHHAYARRELDPESLRAITQSMIQEIDQQFQNSIPKLSRKPLQGSALVYLMHSTEFAGQNLDVVLSRLKSRGAKWVAPSMGALEGYLPKSGECMPRCLAGGDCW